MGHNFRRRYPQAVRFTTYDSEDRAVQVEATYSPPTQDYFSKSFGNWLPGDPEDIEIVSVTAIDEGADVDEVEADTAGLEEAVRLKCDEDAGYGDAGPDTLEEARGER